MAQSPAHALTETTSEPHAVGNDLVHHLGGFSNHSEHPVFQSGFHFFAGMPEIGQLEIVDRGGAIHTNAGDQSFFHHPNDDRSQTAFHDVRAHHEDDALVIDAG